MDLLAKSERRLVLDWAGDISVIEWGETFVVDMTFCIEPVAKAKQSLTQTLSLGVKHACVTTRLVGLVNAMFFFSKSMLIDWLSHKFSGTTATCCAAALSIDWAKHGS